MCCVICIILVIIAVVAIPLLSNASNERSRRLQLVHFDSAPILNLFFDSAPTNSAPTNVLGVS